jgi:hypothetical protein
MAAAVNITQRLRSASIYNGSHCSYKLFPLLNAAMKCSVSCLDKRIEPQNNTTCYPHLESYLPEKNVQCYSLYLLSGCYEVICKISGCCSQSRCLSLLKSLGRKDCAYEAGMRWD